MYQGAALNWREVSEKHHIALVEELSSLLNAQIDRARRETAESFNQILRRLRQTSSASELFSLLAESTASCSAKVVVLSFENNHAEIAASRGVTSAPNQQTFPTETAPAVASAISNKDLVIAAASDAELSPVLAAALEAPVDDKAYLFPILERQNVTAMLAASGNVNPAALELLAEAAGMKLEALSAQSRPVLFPLPDSSLVQLGAVPNADRRAWNELSPEDQKLHLQAQRVARVRVAEMRLYHAEALRKGVLASNIYDSLAPEIDAARTEFLQAFLSKSPTMVDYLHLEILRSLAHDDDRLLGQNYPGPMV